MPVNATRPSSFARSVNAPFGMLPDGHSTRRIASGAMRLPSCSSTAATAIPLPPLADFGLQPAHAEHDRGEAGEHRDHRNPNPLLSFESPCFRGGARYAVVRQSARTARSG